MLPCIFFQGILVIGHHPDALVEFLVLAREHLDLLLLRTLFKTGLYPPDHVVLCQEHDKAHAHADSDDSKAEEGPLVFVSPVLVPVPKIAEPAHPLLTENCIHLVKGS